MRFKFLGPDNVFNIQRILHPFNMIERCIFCIFEMFLFRIHNTSKTIEAERKKGKQIIKTN